MKFIGGLFVNAPRPNAPDFVKGSISINAGKFVNWLKENRELINEKGYINIDLLESQKGDWYAKVNDWKPEKKQEPQPQQ